MSQQATCSNCGQPTRSKYSICARPSCVGEYHRRAARAEYEADPEAARARVATWRQDNPEKRRAHGRIRSTREAEWKRSLKIGKSCVDCGLTCTGDNYPAFDWDHRPGEVKKFNIGAGALHSRANVLAEIAKCDLRCKNCHAIVTHITRREAS